MSGGLNLEGITRLAYAQAMADMIRYSGFVAEDVDGSAIGYWFGPDRVPIEVAPLMYSGDFSVRRGDGIAEAVLVIASHGNDRAFSDLRDYLNEQIQSNGRSRYPSSLQAHGSSSALQSSKRSFPLA
jgi:hypothetical protein